MINTLYRGVIKVSNHGAQNACVKIGIPLDRFFQNEQDVINWALHCRVYLEKTKAGFYNLLIKDSDNKLVKRIKQKESWMLECNSIDPVTRDEYSGFNKQSFEEMFNSLSENKTANLISLDIDMVKVETFKLREESE